MGVDVTTNYEIDNLIATNNRFLSYFTLKNNISQAKYDIHFVIGVPSRFMSKLNNLIKIKLLK